MIPLLFGLDRADLPQGPLVQFQSVLAEKDEVRKLVMSLNEACDDRPLDEGRLASVFDVWWPQLEASLAAIDANEPREPVGQRSEEDVMAEILELVRGQQQLLNNPEALLPPAYVHKVTRSPGFPTHEDQGPDPSVIRDVLRGWHRLHSAAGRDWRSPDPVHTAIRVLAVPMELLFAAYMEMAQYSSVFLPEEAGERDPKDGRNTD